MNVLEGAQHRIGWEGRADVSSSTSCSKQVWLEEVLEGLVQLCGDFLLGWQVHSFSEPLLQCLAILIVNM